MLTNSSQHWGWHFGNDYISQHATLCYITLREEAGLAGAGQQVWQAAGRSHTNNPLSAQALQAALQVLISTVSGQWNEK